MFDPTTSSTCPDPSRRQAIRLLAGAMGACTPATIVLKAYPEAYRPGSDATEDALEAFIDTVVPGLTAEERKAITTLRDPFYPLARYADFFASDLDRRAMRERKRSFQALSAEQRTAVVRGAFSGDPTTRKLYTGAVFLTQVAVYGGIQDDRAGCRLIGFPGGYRLPTATELSYDEKRRFLAPQRFADGNPA
jgi:hypothetical protein